MLLSLTDDVPAVTTDVDIQLLEAAKAGDVEIVKVTNNNNIDCTVTPRYNVPCYDANLVT